MKKWLPPALFWIQYLALAAWVGGLAALPFFATVTFQKLAPDRMAAGDIVGETLRRLGLAHIGCAAAFLASSTLQLWLLRPLSPGFRWRRILALKIITPFLMLLATLHLRFALGPRMEALRAQAPAGGYEAWSDAGRQEFDRLHRRYVHVSQGILLGGAGLFLLLALEGVQPFRASPISSPSDAPSAP
ncbi:MAG: DUF4149 domain-containing protein [Planctomycetes bacterium]|nr:DUF4149 domain-containing protein [Planctomycetota bacterium]